jgi:enamine deaminase RidA (YjgF/YER057c/UK114 family)
MPEPVTAQAIQDRLAALGLALPNPSAPAANYVPWIQSGNLVVISGQIPFLNGEKAHIGKLGADFSLEQGKAAAKACALNILAQIHNAAGGNWSRVARCIRLGGFVNATADFTEHPAVLNGASDLIVAVLGDAGKHARAAVGVSSLPFGVAVEIEATFELRP